MKNICFLRTPEKFSKAAIIIDCESKIFVVDNESNDRTAQVARKFGAKVFR